jgi:hypothetical protein
MIQIVSVAGVNSLAEYVEHAEDLKVDRPVRCQRESCGRSNGFWKHTGYKRTAREGELSVVVSIERFLCKYCGLVVSCLFDFLIPYVIFSVKAVAAVVNRYASNDTSYRELAGNAAALNSGENDKGPRPSHVQIFRWVARLANQSSVLLVHVQRLVVNAKQELFGEQGLFCPNRWKTLTVEKVSEVDALLELLVLSSQCCGARETTVVEWLHRYFSQTYSMHRAILSGRKLRLSAQQRT